METLLSDKSFNSPSPLAQSARARSVAQHFIQWISCNKDRVGVIEDELTGMMRSCFRHKRKRQATYREVMWEKYHTLRTSNGYCYLWEMIQKEVMGSDSVPCPIFYQNVGHCMFKQMIKLHHPLMPQSDSLTTPPPITYEEMNTLRYVAGYIPRLLRKRLEKSTHKLKDDIKLCIYDLLDDGDEDEEDNSTKDWVNIINRGGLTLVNNMTFDVFVAIEEEVRKIIHKANSIPNFNDHTKKSVVESEAVQFFWSMLSVEWEEESGDVLLEMIVNQYITVRGFSLASAWMEKFKQVSKITTQKSKGIRKELIPPAASASACVEAPKSVSPQQCHYALGPQFAQFPPQSAHSPQLVTFQPQDIA